MNVSEITASKINSNSSSIIKLNNQTIRELRAIAKGRGLRGYYNLRKAELVSLLETSMGPPRRPGRAAMDQMDVFEQQEIARTRSAVKSKLKKWYDWIVDYVPESVKKPVSSAFSMAKNHICLLYTSPSPRDRG